MKGSFKISHGVFETDDFKINGTSADVEIKGRSDFPNDHIENCVYVTPDLSASLPVIAGWAIEPVTGVLVFLMSKIFKPALKVVTGILYKVEGSFSDPEVEQIKKSEGTVTVYNSDENKPRIIQPNTELPEFKCNAAFNN